MLCVDFRRFRVFVFYHRAYSKTWNPRKVLFLLFYNVRFFLNIIYQVFGDSCEIFRHFRDFQHVRRFLGIDLAHTLLNCILVFHKYLLQYFCFLSILQFLLEYVQVQSCQTILYNYHSHTKLSKEFLLISTD